MEVQYPLVFFTLLLCLSSGMLLFQGILMVMGRGTKKFHTCMIVTELVVLALGGFSSFLHLHHWERMFNGFGHLSSGITQELIGIVVTVIALAIMFGMLRRKPADGAAPAADGKVVATWVGVLAIVVGVVMGFVCAHSYYMSARPAWSNVTLYLYYYASEFVLGTAGTWLVAGILKEDAGVSSLMAKLTCIAGIVSAVVIVIAGIVWSNISFANVGYSFHTTEPTAPLPDPSGTLGSPLTGSEAGLFWGGAVVVGSLVAAVCGFFGWKQPKLTLPVAGGALVCSLIGGVCYRVVLYAVGVSYYVYFLS